MIPIFQLTPEQRTELDEKLRNLGDFDPMQPGAHMGVILRFHEDIHIKILLEEMGED